MWSINNQEEFDNIKGQKFNIEFDWIGIDKNDNIAIFSNFNSGYVPEKVTKSLELFNSLVELINNLNSVTEVEKVTKSTGDYTDWINYSKQGIFAYDNQNVHLTINTNQYELISKPINPIKSYEIEDLKHLEKILPKFDLEFTSLLKFIDLETKLL